MIIPLGHRLLVKPVKLEQVDPIIARAMAAGLELPSAEREREQAAVDQGEVIALGATAFKDFGESPWCNVGDKIAYTRYGGKLIKDPSDGVQYIILNDEDCICRFDSKELTDGN